MMDWNTVVQAHLRTAKSNLRRDGRLAPVIIAYDPGDKAALLGVPFRNDDEKYAMLAAVKVLFAQQRIQRYIALADTWLLELPADVRSDDTRPSEHPNRVEAVIAAWRDGEKRGLEIHTYRRSPMGKVTSFSHYEAPPGVTVGGEWLDLIPDNPTDNARRE
jgi:hypothetical protein